MDQQARLAQSLRFGDVLLRAGYLLRRSPPLVGLTMLVATLPALLPDKGPAMVFSLRHSPPQLTSWDGSSLAIGIAEFLVQVVLQVALARAFLDVGRGRPVGPGTLWDTHKDLVPGLVTVLLVVFATALGTIAMVIPGVIVWTGLLMSVNVLVDRRCGPVEALRTSWRLTSGHKPTVFLVYVVIAFFFSFSCNGIGPNLLYAPLASLTQAAMYQLLVERSRPTP